jgi:hypothetical protein
MKLQPWHSQLTLYACNIPSVVCAGPPEDEQGMFETRRGSRFLINWIKSASRWFHFTDILWYKVNKTLSLSEIFFILRRTEWGMNKNVYVFTLSTRYSSQIIKKLGIFLDRFCKNIEIVRVNFVKTSSRRQIVPCGRTQLCERPYKRRTLSLQGAFQLKI